MKVFNYLFYFILFISFILPNNKLYFLDIGFVKLYIREIGFFLLPILNYLSKNENKKGYVMSVSFRKLAYIFFITIILNEIFKILIFNNTIFDIFNDIRFGLPFFSCLLILMYKIKPNINRIWKIYLFTIGCSFILTILSFMLNFPLYPISSSENSIENFEMGRFFNSNFEFAFFGIYLLLNKDYKLDLTTKIVSILSIIVLILSFSRTGIAFLLLYILYIMYKKFSFKTFIYTVFSVVFLFFLTLGVYNTNDSVRNQVDRRILSTLTGTRTLEESVYKNNRDFIVEGVTERLSEGYWFLGIPSNLNWYSYSLDYLDYDLQMRNTDTSLVNVLLKYGLLPFILFILIYFKIYNELKFNNLISSIIILFMIISINADFLFRYNTVFTLILLITLIKYAKKANYIHSQDQLK